MRFVLAILLLAATAGIASAQQPAPDPASLQLKLQGVQFLLDARERQIVDVGRQAEAERAYWAAYVAGLKPAK